MNEKQINKPKFKVGDWVTIVTDLNQRRHPPGVNREMLKLQGQTFRVKSVPTFSTGNYRLDEKDGWAWSEDWLEEPVEIKDIEESEFLSVFEA